MLLQVIQNLEILVLIVDFILIEVPMVIKPTQFYNLGHNILRLFDVLPNFPFTTGNKHGIYDLPHELPHDLRLGILGNWKILRRSQISIKL